MRSIIVIFLTSLFFCVACLHQEPTSQNQTAANGRVLGVSEAAADTILGNSGFPVSPYNEIPAIPHRIANNPIALDADCLGIVMDGKSDAVLFEKEADTKTPIASITKLATALVFLDTNPDLNKLHTITHADLISGNGYVYLGEQVALKDLLHIGLIGSSNTAAKALANSTGMTEEQFVAAMNAKMKELGLNNTSFVDPVGLSRWNVSTPREVAKLAQAAFSRPEISSIVQMKKYTLTTAKGAQRSVYNTNKLLEQYDNDKVEILGGKTGYTEASGYCLVSRFADKAGHDVISVVLSGATPSSRFNETEKLVNWTYDNYIWN